MNKQRYTADTRRIPKNVKSISEIDFSRTYLSYGITTSILLDVTIA